MPTYFADTSFWIALVDRRDAYHACAVDWSMKSSGRIVTTQSVLTETANSLSRPAWRDKAISLIDHLLNRVDVEIVPPTELLWDLGWKLFSERIDKAWSLTDCISFEVMQERGLTKALTADEHFRQAGFHAVLLDGE